MEKSIDTVTLSPADRHNTTLLELAHPADWINPEPSGSYNLVVIGAGTAGLVCAAGAAALGAKVAMIERHLTGGDCLNFGCVPSKALIRSARAAADIRRAETFGVNVPSGTVTDFPVVMERMRALRAGIAPADSVERFAGLGVDVFLGQGRFTGKKTVEVGGKELRFAKAVIATGGRASAPPIPGLEEAGYLTNETLFSLTELPKRVAIIGAGPIGCEMAQSLARFGAQTHLIEVFDQILAKEPPRVAAVVENSLIADGVDLRKSCKTSRIEKRGNERVVFVESDRGTEEIFVDEIVVSVGRKPNIEGLELELAGVDYDERTGVVVNDYLQTSNKRIYAAGDICSPYKFTHTAAALAAIVIQNALFARTKKSSTLTIPWCTYTDPEVAHVGLYPADAEREGIETSVWAAKMDDVDRAILDGDTDGLVEIYTKKGTDKIVGGTIVASHAGEMIGELTVAIQAGLSISSLSSVIHPYPTQADAIRKAASEYQKGRLTPRVKKLMIRWMAMRR